MPIRTGVIYKITNTVIGKSYVGMSMNLKERIKTHFSSPDSAIRDDVRKYGRSAFTVKVLESGVVENRLRLREKFWILECNTIVPNGYNGGKSGANGAGAKGAMVDRWLLDEHAPDSSHWADRYIAEQCGVSRGLVQRRDKELRLELGEAYQRPDGRKYFKNGKLFYQEVSPASPSTSSEMQLFIPMPDGEAISQAIAVLSEASLTDEQVELVRRARELFAQ